MRTLSQWSHVGLCIGVIDEELLKYLQIVLPRKIFSRYVKINESDFGKRAIVSARWKGVIVDVFEDDWLGHGVVQILRPQVDDLWQVEKAVRICINEVGKRYDFCGLVDFIFFRKFQSESRWFCSELAFYAYQKAGFAILARKEKEFVSPGDLYESPKLVLVG